MHLGAYPANGLRLRFLRLVRVVRCNSPCATAANSTSGAVSCCPAATSMRSRGSLADCQSRIPVPSLSCPLPKCHRCHFLFRRRVMASASMRDLSSSPPVVSSPQSRRPAVLTPPYLPECSHPGFRGFSFVYEPPTHPRFVMSFVGFESRRRLVDFTTNGIRLPRRHPAATSSSWSRCASPIDDWPRCLRQRGRRHCQRRVLLGGLVEFEVVQYLPT